MDVDDTEMARYAEMQQSALRLDGIMRQMMREVGPDALARMPKWKQLIGLRKSMQKLLPAGHPAFVGVRRKKGVTMDFNGIDVSIGCPMFQFPCGFVGSQMGRNCTLSIVVNSLKMSPC